MKTQNQNDWESILKTAGTLGLAVAMLCLAGCASAPYHKGDVAAVSLQNASSEVQGQSRALEMTMGSLDDLVNKPEPDLKPQFKRFSKSLDNLAGYARRNERSQARVRDKSAAYFEAWDKQVATMNYETIRTQSQERKTEVINSYNSVNRRYRESQDAMGPLLSYLYDVRKVLDTDLTPGGIEAVKPLVSKARENADRVQLALGRLTTELASSGAHMSSLAYENRALPATGTSQQTAQAQPQPQAEAQPQAKAQAQPQK
jgi:Protein of unknown function (DUF2959)